LKARLERFGLSRGIIDEKAFFAPLAKEQHRTGARALKTLSNRDLWLCQRSSAKKAIRKFSRGKGGGKRALQSSQGNGPGDT